MSFFSFACDPNLTFLTIFSTESISEPSHLHYWNEEGRKEKEGRKKKGGRRNKEGDRSKEEGGARRRKEEGGGGKDKRREKEEEQWGRTFLQNFAQKKSKILPRWGRSRPQKTLHN